MYIIVIILICVVAFILYGKIFGNNITAYRVILALIHTVPVVLIFRKYSKKVAKCY